MTEDKPKGLLFQNAEITKEGLNHYRRKGNAADKPTFEPGEQGALDPSFAPLGRDMFGDPIKPTAQRTLAQRWTFPPFSVLDARNGDWQERKRSWLALGIQSELGRGENIVPNGTIRTPDADGAYQRGYGKKGTAVAFPGNRGLAQMMKTGDRHIVHEDGTAAAEAPWESGTSVFDPVLCELAYKWWSPADARVIDPFAGGSVRGIVAAMLGRHYQGIDLSAPQIAANVQQGADILPVHGAAGSAAWHCGDSKDPQCPPYSGQHDFMFSCPPYGNLERYSDDPRDISTYELEDFLEAYNRIIAIAADSLRDNRFACFVVGDYRLKDGTYANFVSQTIAAFEAAGLRLYNEAILVTVAGSLPVRAHKQFDAGRKLGKSHQNVLLFVKGDPRAAADACKV